MQITGVYKMSEEPVEKPLKHNPDKEEFIRATTEVYNNAMERKKLNAEQGKDSCH